MSSAFEGLPKTPNLKLNKPGYDNVSDIEALNENADILDAEIQGIKNTFVKSVNGINAGDDGNVDLGIIPISQGGTGQTTASGVRNALGLGNTTGAVPIANGGTGANNASDACANIGAIQKVNGISADSENNVDVNALKTLVIDGILSKTKSYFDGLNVHSLYNRNEEIGELPDATHGTADSNLLTVKHKDNMEANQIYFNGDWIHYRFNEDDNNEAWSNWLQFDLIESMSLGKNSGYIKYVSGLQICYGQNIVATANAWTYPRAFKYLPIIVCTHNGSTNVIISASSTTTTSTKTLANWSGGGSIPSGNVGGDCHIICIGIGV